MSVFLEGVSVPSQLATTAPTATMLSCVRMCLNNILRSYHIDAHVEAAKQGATLDAHPATFERP